MKASDRFKLFGTWKNKLTVAQSVELAEAVVAKTAKERPRFTLSFCPPMIALEAVKQRLPDWIPLTAQNLVWDDSVSFTGETSAGALRELGCRYVIVGHSERRQYLGESDEIVFKKVSTAVKHELVPVVCVGELFEDYRGGRSERVVATQTKVVLDAVEASVPGSEFIIAYEPAWAISTSKEALKCDPALANERHLQIRGIVAARLGRAAAERLTILYGGSVAPDNAADFFRQSEVDGGLVGTASQTRESFLGLVEVARRVSAEEAEGR